MPIQKTNRELIELLETYFQRRGGGLLAHDIIGPYHYVVGGDTLDLIGQDAPGSLAIVTPSANPGISSKVLKTDAFGHLDLDQLTVDYANVQKEIFIADYPAALENITIHSFFANGLTSGVATSIFRITTPNDPGNNDGGAYSCFVKGCISHQGSYDATNVAAKAFEACFARAMKNTGSGQSSAVSEIVESASAATNAAVRDITGVTMTTIETSEYDVDVQITVTLSGTDFQFAEVMLQVTLFAYGFITRPYMIQL